MSRVAVFVDAGYFWVQACNVITGAYNSRQQLIVDYEKFRSALLNEVAKQFPGKELLRVYWYDGPGNQTGNKTAEHRAIDNLNDFKLRLGTRNTVGQQKGVDGLIIADLVSLTQQKAINSALLISGDADTAPGVVAAQGMGLRVHLLSIGGPQATSPYLAAEVDSKTSWVHSEVSVFASQAPTATASTGAGASTLVPAGSSVNMVNLAQLAKAHIAAGPNPAAASLASMSRGATSIPFDVDKALLGFARTHLGRNLDDQEKRDLRREFKSLI